MSDYLLVHGTTQGARSWGKVWGHMTAPVEHPPRLYRPKQALRVRAIDLPGHGADRGQDAALVSLREGVKAIADVVEGESFSDYVLVGHELGGTVALRAVGELAVKPRRIVLVSGIVPASGKPALSAYPLATRAIVRSCAMLSGLTGRDITVPSDIIGRYWFGELDMMRKVEAIGHSGPLPLRMLTEAAGLNLEELPCPVTYIVLTNNRLIAAGRQRAMAARVPGASVIELNAGHQVAVASPQELANTLLAAS